MSFISNVGLRDGDDASKRAAVEDGRLAVNLSRLGGAAADAFGRLRVSTPFAVFDSKQDGDNLPLLYDEATFGTGSSTHSAAEARSRLETAASGDAVIRQTFQRFHYQTAKSQQIFMTFVAPQEANVRKRIGLFEGSNVANSVPQNGIYYESTGTDLAWAIAKGGTQTRVAQAAWNEDPLDGTGPSGATLNPANAQILVVDFEWLGEGIVRVGFVIGGAIIYCHFFYHANVAQSVYMSSPDLPVNYSIYQDGAGSGTLDAICASVASEGGVEENGLSFAADTGSTRIEGDSGTRYALVGIRLKAAYNRTVIPQLINGLADSANDSWKLELALNPTIAGTAPTFADLTNSACQTAVGVAANTVTGGTVLASGYAHSDSTLNIPARIFPRIGKAIDGTPDELWVVGQPADNSVDMLASLNWIELV